MTHESVDSAESTQATSSAARRNPSKSAVEPPLLELSDATPNLGARRVVEPIRARDRQRTNFARSR